MDPERHREISRRGGEASHGGQGRDWEEYRSRGGRGGSRYEADERDSRGRFVSSGGSSRYDSGDERSSSPRRGFAAMDPEERREFGRMGARARWGDGYGSSSRAYGESRDWQGRFTGSGRGHRFDDDEERYGRRRGDYGRELDEPREFGRAGNGGGWGYDDERYGRGSRFEENERDSRGRFLSSGRSSPYYADEDDRSSGRYERYDWSSPYERERFGGTTSRSWRSYE